MCMSHFSVKSELLRKFSKGKENLFWAEDLVGAWRAAKKTQADLINFDQKQINLTAMSSSRCPTPGEVPTARVEAFAGLTLTQVIVIIIIMVVITFTIITIAIITFIIKISITIIFRIIIIKKILLTIAVFTKLMEEAYKGWHQLEESMVSIFH